MPLKLVGEPNNWVGFIFSFGSRGLTAGKYLFRLELGELTSITWPAATILVPTVGLWELLCRGCKLLVLYDISYEKTACWMLIGLLSMFRELIYVVFIIYCLRY